MRKFRRGSRIKLKQINSIVENTVEFVSGSGVNVSREGNRLGLSVRRPEIPCAPFGFSAINAAAVGDATGIIDDQTPDVGTAATAMRSDAWSGLMLVGDPADNDPHQVSEANEATLEFTDQEGTRYGLQVRIGASYGAGLGLLAVGSGGLYVKYKVSGGLIDNGDGLELDSTIEATTGKFDHIAELTGAHTVTFDNNITLAAGVDILAGSTACDLATLAAPLGNIASTAIYNRGANGGGATLRNSCYSSTASDTATFQSFRHYGTYAAPAAVGSGAYVGGFQVTGAYDGTPNYRYWAASILAIASEAWDSTHNGCRWDFYTTAAGATAAVRRCRIDELGIAMDSGYSVVSGTAGASDVGSTTRYFGSVYATTHYADHIAERTGAHTVTFDNNVTIANTKDILAATAGGSDLGATGTGWGDIYLDTTHKVQFRDAAIYIQSGADGHLDITADTSIDLNIKAGIVSGAVGAPGLFMLSDEDSGLYLIADARIGMAIAGALQMELFDGGLKAPDSKAFDAYTNGGYVKLRYATKEGAPADGDAVLGELLQQTNSLTGDEWLIFKNPNGSFKWLGLPV